MKKILFALGVALALFACEEDKSDENKITNFTASNASGGLIVKDIDIDDQFSVVTVIFDHTLTANSYPVSFTPEISLSGGASITNADAQLSFSSDSETCEYMVKAEDGTGEIPYVQVFAQVDGTINGDLIRLHGDGELDEAPEDQSPGAELRWSSDEDATSPDSGVPGRISTIRANHFVSRGSTIHENHCAIYDTCESPHISYLVGR